MPGAFQLLGRCLRLLGQVCHRLRVGENPFRDQRRILIDERPQDEAFGYERWGEHGASFRAGNKRRYYAS